MTDSKQLDLWFTYHQPGPPHIAKYTAVRVAAREFAQVILDNTYSGKDQEAAFTFLRSAVGMADASIAFEGK